MVIDGVGSPVDSHPCRGDVGVVIVVGENQDVGVAAALFRLWLVG